MTPPVTFKRGDYQKQTWKLVRLPGGTRTATVTCPRCGQTSSLKDWIITLMGRVVGQWKCPKMKCPTVEYIFLKGWGSK